jgi:hypothetical protein
MKITIETVPHDEQRPEIGGSVADWQFLGPIVLTRDFEPSNSTVVGPATLSVKVSDQGDWRKEACLAIHELVEALICKHLGVTDKQVDEFDREWKENGNYDEQGEDPKAPYYAAHQAAMVVERLLAKELGIVWADYEAQIDEIFEKERLKR